MKERILSLDVMRGISLMGILFMNALGVHYFTVFDMPFDYYQDHLSQWLYKLNLLLIQNSFYPIFAFLFGVGLSIMNTNILSKGMRPGMILYRRMAAMLLFGLLHGYFLYNGDILHTYAVMGMIAIPFLWFKRPIALMLASSIWLINLLLFLTSFNDVAKKVIPFHRNVQTDEILSSGNVLHIIQWNMAEFSKVNTILSLGNVAAGIMTVLPFILFGIAAHRYALFHKMKKHPKYVAVFGGILFVLGMIIKMQSFNIIGSALAPQTLFIGGSCVAVGYFSLITLLCNNDRTMAILKPMQAVGKLGFTVYIMQSIILFLIFYVFKLYGTLTISAVYIIVISIAYFQIVFCNIYLKHYKMGPLEWLWRKITYLK